MIVGENPPMQKFVEFHKNTVQKSLMACVKRFQPIVSRPKIAGYGIV
jgi:hypothetical protein